MIIDNQIDLYQKLRKEVHINRIFNRQSVIDVLDSADIISAYFASRVRLNNWMDTISFNYIFNSITKQSLQQLIDCSDIIISIEFRGNIQDYDLEQIRKVINFCSIKRIKINTDILEIRNNFKEAFNV